MFERKIPTLYILAVRFVGTTHMAATFSSKDISVVDMKPIARKEYITSIPERYLERALEIGEAVDIVVCEYSDELLKAFKDKGQEVTIVTVSTTKTMMKIIDSRMTEKGGCTERYRDCYFNECKAIADERRYITSAVTLHVLYRECPYVSCVVNTDIYAMRELQREKEESKVEPVKEVTTTETPIQPMKTKGTISTVAEFLQAVDDAMPPPKIKVHVDPLPCTIDKDRFLELCSELATSTGTEDYELRCFIAAKVINNIITVCETRIDMAIREHDYLTNVINTIYRNRPESFPYETCKELYPIEDKFTSVRSRLELHSSEIIINMLQKLTPWRDYYTSRNDFNERVSKIVHSRHQLIAVAMKYVPVVSGPNHTETT